MIIAPAISAENPRQKGAEPRLLDLFVMCQFWILQCTYESLQFATHVNFVMTILQQLNSTIGVTEIPQPRENWMTM